MIRTWNISTNDSDWLKIFRHTSLARKLLDLSLMTKSVPNFANVASLLFSFVLALPTLAYAKLPGGTEDLKVNRTFTYGTGTTDRTNDPGYDQNNIGSFNTQGTTTDYGQTQERYRTDDDRGKQEGGGGNSFSTSRILADLVVLLVGSLDSNAAPFGERLLSLVLYDVVAPFGGQYVDSLTQSSGFSSQLTAALTQTAKQQQEIDALKQQYECPTGTCADAGENPFGELGWDDFLLTLVADENQT